MIKTNRKPNGDLNLDIDSVIETYPEIAGSKCDDEEQKAISVALVPYIIEEMKSLRKCADSKQSDSKITNLKSDIYKEFSVYRALIVGLIVAVLYLIMVR